MLTPKYCGPLEILKGVGSSVYHTTLPHCVGIHTFFHINHCKDFLGSNDNTITFTNLVTIKNLSYKPIFQNEFLILKPNQHALRTFVKSGSNGWTKPLIMPHGKEKILLRLNFPTLYCKSASLNWRSILCTHNVRKGWAHYMLT